MLSPQRQLIYIITSFIVCQHLFFKNFFNRSQINVAKLKRFSFDVLTRRSQRAKIILSPSFSLVNIFFKFFQKVFLLILHHFFTIFSFGQKINRYSRKESSPLLYLLSSLKYIYFYLKSLSISFQLLFHQYRKNNILFI